MRMSLDVRSTKMDFRGRLRQVLATLVSLTFAIGSMALGPLTPAAKALPVPQSGAGAGSGGCNLNSPGGQIQHVIFIQFDNVHFRRDNPNVPSDLEQMPNLLNFLTKNGAFLPNHYTPLKSHTADDIITSLTGVYGDRHGGPIANSFGWFLQPASNETPTDFDGFGSTFTYWTDPVNVNTDDVPEMITADGKNAPAPWVSWTRAGCNVGAASIANMELENVASDLISVFGSDPATLTAAQAEVKANRAKAIADFEGIAIHCAAGNSVCSTNNGGEPDLLPQEPGTYVGFNALYGHKFVAPVISPGGPLVDLNGNPVTDNSNPPNPGFPGFSGISAYQTLAYVAAMQEHGVPITYAYISDAHDNHSTAVKPTNIYGPTECTTNPAEQGDGFGDSGLGPGDECYERQLAAYNDAFGKFFARLTADGITPANALFVITADENDHFAGAGPVPANCDGMHAFCSYSKLGEIDANLTAQLDTEDPALASTPFDIQFDMVPVFYVEGDPAVGAPIAREYERDAATLMAVSPITGQQDQLTAALADPVEMKLLHMVTGDPNRTPTFVMFGNPNWFWSTSGGNPVEDPGFVWNHGGIQSEIITTWLGLVGPGVKAGDFDSATWTDHTDIRPTMLALTGLQDDYQSQGRVISEALQPWAVPASVNTFAFREVAQAYKEINAPVGPLGLASLKISTHALASGSSSDDSTYAGLEDQISQITAARDALATQMANALDGAEFHGKSIDPFEADILAFEADVLTDYVRFLASQQ